MAELSKDFAAFANTEGGHILIGVADNGTIVGAEFSPSLLSRLYAEAQRCKPPVFIDVEEIPVGRLNVVLIGVPKSNFIHTDSRDRFPYRTGNTTSCMDFGVLLMLAKSRNLVPGESTSTDVNLTAYGGARQKANKKTYEYIFDALKSSNNEVAREALLDLRNSGAPLEKFPEFTNLMVQYMKSDDLTIRDNAIFALGSREYVVKGKQREEMLDKVTPVLTQIAMKDPDPNVRARAITYLCYMGTPSSIDTIIGLIKTEEEQTYQRLAPKNYLSIFAQKGLGHMVRERLYKELVSTDNPVTKQRIKEMLETLRNQFLG